jgi:hypothetical protein
MFVLIICLSTRSAVVVKADQVDPVTPSPAEAVISPFPTTTASPFTPLAPVATNAPTLDQASATTDAPIIPSPTEEPITFAPTPLPQPTESGPTVSESPTDISSDSPSVTPTSSYSPTGSPTLTPTGFPTFEQRVVSTGRFSQRFDVGDGQLFTDQELFLVEGLYRSYTPNFAQPPEAVALGLITTECTVDNQVEVVTTTAGTPGTRKLASDSSSPSSYDSDNQGRGKLYQSSGSAAIWKKQKQEKLSNESRQWKPAMRRSNGNITHTNNIDSAAISYGNWTKVRQNRTGQESRLRLNRQRNKKKTKQQRHGSTPYSSSVDIQIQRRRLQAVEVIQLDYTMTYDSQAVNVSLYPVLFQNFVNSNLEQVSLQLQTLGLNVTSVQIANRIIPRTSAPSVSMMPSMAPTGYPTISPSPTVKPTIAPSFGPPSGGGQRGTIIVVVSVVIALLIVGIGLMIWCRNRKQRREMKFQASAVRKGQPGSGGPSEHEGSGWDGHGDAPLSSYHSNRDNSGYYGRDSESPEANLMYGSTFRQYSSSEARDQDIATADSRASNQSFLSTGNLAGGSVGGIEVDNTQMLADEFDQYQDHDLERMRADIECNLEGCDGMMNQAVARALIDEDDALMDKENSTDYMWGCPLDSTGIQIEAGVLWYIVDWLKRNKEASVEDK